MNTSLENFWIAKNADGQSIRLPGSTDESLYLAFDLKAKRLVELHAPGETGELDAQGKRSTFERAALASELQCDSISHILEMGEDDGLIYYSSTLNDGELVEEYIARQGALPAATALCLVLQLMEDLIRFQSYHRLISQLKLDRLLVTTVEDTFLRLRICDFGLSGRERRTDGGFERLTAEICKLIFFLLTSHPFKGQDPDLRAEISSLASGLRSTLRTVLADETQAPASLEKLRDDVKESFTAIVNNLQARSEQRHLVVTSENMRPRSWLQALLLENLTVGELLKGHFAPEACDNTPSCPFSIPARSVENDRRVTVHLLPPDRIVPKDQYEAVPLQMWRIDPQRHPNIFPSQSPLEISDWTLLTEERDGAIPLSRLIAGRIAMNPSEVLVLLRQVCDGIDQMLQCGVTRFDLHPSNLLIQVTGAGELPARNFERLQQKRVDVWPPFLLKLRPHATMRSLYEPLLSGRADDENTFNERLCDKDIRSRSFMALAAFLLSGKRMTTGEFDFPEIVPQSLARYICEALEMGRKFGETPAPRDFLTGIEMLVGPTSEEKKSSSALLGRAAVSSDEMESAGFVSDFFEDSDQPDIGPAAFRSKLKARMFPSKKIPSIRRNQKLVTWGAYYAGVILILLFLLAGFFGNHVSSDSAASVSPAPDKSPPAESERPPLRADAATFEIRRAVIPSSTEMEELRKKDVTVVKAGSAADAAAELANPAAGR